MTSLTNDFRLNLESLLELPNRRVYWKDLSGAFLGCNQTMANDLNLSNPDHIRGLSDFDLPTTAKNAKIYRQNDQIGIHKGTAVEFREVSLNTLENKNITYHSIKMPLQSNDNKTIGIIGITTILHSEDASLPNLSTRQKDCLYHMALGLTVKEMSLELDLSPRTVEHYIEIIKSKLNCHSRSMLVKKAFEFTFIREKLLNE